MSMIDWGIFREDPKNLSDSRDQNTARPTELRIIHNASMTTRSIENGGRLINSIVPDNADFPSVAWNRALPSPNLNFWRIFQSTEYNLDFFLCFRRSYNFRHKFMEILNVKSAIFYYNEIVIRSTRRRRVTPVIFDSDSIYNDKNVNDTNNFISEMK